MTPNERPYARQRGWRRVGCCLQLVGQHAYEFEAKSVLKKRQKQYCFELKVGEQPTASKQSIALIALAASLICEQKTIARARARKASLCSTASCAQQNAQS